MRTLREFYLKGQWDLITELPHNWGNKLLEGTNKALCAPGSRRKEQWPHNRLGQTCLWVSRSLWQRHGSTVACCGVRGSEYNSAGISPFEGGRHYHHCLRANNREGTQPCPTENWIKDLLSMAPPNRTRPGLPQSQSFPSGSFYKLLIHQREDRMKTTITEN